MPVTERLMAIGDWSVRFREDMPVSVRRQLGLMGHIAVFPSRVDARRISNTDLLNKARYVGVVRRREQGLHLGGSSLAYWLGDEDNKGAVITTPIVNEFTGFQDWITDLVGGGISLGSFFGTVPGINLTWTAYLVTRRGAIDFVCQAFGGEWRINPNGTLDAGLNTALFRSTPQVIATRRGVGSDPQMRGVLGARIGLSEDTEDYVTNVTVLGQGEGPGIGTGVAFVVGTPYRQALTSNDASLVRVVSAPTALQGSEDDIAAAILAQSTPVRQAVSLTSESYDIGRDLKAGDWLWVYDPELGLVHAANQVVHRGQYLNPVKLRAFATTWPVESGMGVYYRTIPPLGGNPTYIDLSNWVEWENDALTTVEVGAPVRTLTDAPSAIGGPPEIVDRVNARGMVPFWQETLAASTASLVSPTIPPGYKSILLIVTARDVAGGTVNNLVVQCNGDTGANYDVQIHQGNNTAGSASNSTGTASPFIGLCAGAAAVANVYALNHLTIGDYANTARRKVIVGSSGYNDGTSANGIVRHGTITWRNTNAITSLLVKSSSGSSLAAGTTVEGYLLG